MSVAKRLLGMMSHPHYLAILIGAINAVAFFPGTMSPDAEYQLFQARSGHYNDWHPPIMAAVWSLFVNIRYGESAIFMLHQMAYWCAIALIAATVRERGDLRLAWTIVVASCLPYFLYINQLIIKDVGVATSFLLAFALIYRRSSVERPRSAFYLLSILLLITYGSLARKNSIFALGPMILMILPYDWRLSSNSRYIAVISLTVSLLAIPASNTINNDMLNASRSDAEQSLQMFDIVGTYAFSRNEAVLVGWSIDKELVRTCYTPFWWDSLAAWGICAKFRPAMGQDSNSNGTGGGRPERTQMWLRAIRTEPVAYVLHRIYHFNSSLYFIVPAFHNRYSKNIYGDPRDGSLGEKIWKDYLKKNFLVWPVFWMTIAAIYIATFKSAANDLRDIHLSRLLIYSGLFYGIGYFVVGVATEPRYYYWTMLATTLGVLLSLSRITQKWRSSRRWRWCVSLTVVGVVLVGYGARIVDIALPGT